MLGGLGHRGAASKPVALAAYKVRDIVSAKDPAFGVKGDNKSDDAAALQVAFSTGADVWLPGSGLVYLVLSALSLPANATLYSDGNATIRAGAVMNQIVSIGAACRLRGIKFDAGNTQGAAAINADGAVRAVYVKEVTDTEIGECTFTKFRQGLTFESTVAGTECARHVVAGNSFNAGYTWPGSKPENSQIGVYCGSTASVQNLQIGSMAAQELEASDVHSISFADNKFFEGQYGLALHRCSGISVVGNVFERMSRAISMQQQSHDIAITGNSIFNVDTTGVHMAYGVNGVVVSGNTIRGTMANDNVGIQAYYGVKNILIANNVLDSAFDEWAGGASLELRAPNDGIRIGQYAQNIAIVGNSVRGFLVGIDLKSTIYEGVITGADPNYYFSGLEHIVCANNQVEFDYEVLVATAYRAQFLQSNSFGVWAYKSGAWEDTSLGGLTCRGVRLHNNVTDTCRYPYAIQKVVNTAANPVHWKDFWISASYAYGSGATDASVYSGTNASDTIYEANNSWIKNWTPILAGSVTPGAHTYSFQDGWYYQAGRVIHFGANFVVSAKDAAMAGNATITGFPFTVSAQAGRNQPVTIGNWGNFTIAGYSGVSGYMQANTAAINLLKNGTAVNSAFVAAADCGLVNITISGSVMVD